MIIQKVKQVSQLFAKVLNIKSDSKEDTYSADYINQLFDNLDIDAIKELESPVRIWGQEDGLYKLPSGCVIYYLGETSESSFSVSSTSYLFITTYNDYKVFYILGGTNTRYIYNGYSTSTNGTYATFNISSSYLSTSDVRDNLLTSTAGTSSVLSAHQGYVLNEKIQNLLATSEDDATGDTEIIVNPSEIMGSEVVNSLEGDETDKAPSVAAVNAALENFDGSGIKELESSVRIWNLEGGIYKLPKNSTVYYYGESNTTNYITIDSSSILIIVEYSTTSKIFYIFHSVTTTRRITNGYSTSTAGGYNEFRPYVADDLTSASTVTPLSAKQGKVLNEKMQNLIVVGDKSDATSDTELLIDDDEIGSYGDTYSTEETRIGTWIDGKPLYRKVIIVDSLPNAGIGTYAHNIVNADMVLVTNSWNYNTETTSSGDYAMMPNMWGSEVGGIYANRTAINVRVTVDYSKRKGIFILNYTKTTD